MNTARFPHSKTDSVISASAMTPEAVRYRQEQLRIASQAAEKNPELTGSRAAVSITNEEKEKLMNSLIPLMFFDGRLYFATKTSVGQPPVLCLPPNVSFSEFVQNYAPHFAVVYGDPLPLSEAELRKRGASSLEGVGVGHLKFSKVAINPDRVVGIYPEQGWSTCVEVAGPSHMNNSSGGFFAKKDNSGGSFTLANCTVTTNLKISSAIGDVLRKLRPESYENICRIVGNNDIGFGKRL